jgi:N-acetylmuramoyl-L-alanine amidase
VPDRFLERWEYEGEEHYFSDRFKGHSIFISSDNADPNGSLLFGHLMGEQLKARGLQYTPHYIEKFMGHRQRLLVDAKTGVYRYDQLIVLKSTRMPESAQAARSSTAKRIVADSERQSIMSAAVTDAVESFCAVRRPRHIERARASAVGKPPLSLSAGAQSANPATGRPAQ